MIWGTYLPNLDPDVAHRRSSTRSSIYFRYLDNFDFVFVRLVGFSWFQSQSSRLTEVSCWCAWHWSTLHWRSSETHLGTSRFHLHRCTTIVEIIQRNWADLRHYLQCSKVNQDWCSSSLLCKSYKSSKSEYSYASFISSRCIPAKKFETDSKNNLQRSHTPSEYVESSRHFNWDSQVTFRTCQKINTPREP